MAIDNNPLKQYFRRPALYLTLPSKGKGYPANVLSPTETGEIPIYPMTAIDDITAKTPDALFNGQAVVDIIKSCVPNILDPWGINSVDLDAVLIAIKSASSTGTLDVESICTKCDGTSKYGINLSHLLASLKSGDYNEELEINELKVKFRPLTYREMNQVGMQQFEMQKIFVDIESSTTVEEKTEKSKNALKTIADVSMQALSRTIEYIGTPNGIVDNKDYIMDFLHNCDKHTYEAIRDHNAKLKEQSDIKPLKISCVHCSHEYEQPFTLNMTDFFA